MITPSGGVNRQLLLGTGGNILNPSCMHANSNFKALTDVMVIADSDEKVLRISWVNFDSIDGLRRRWYVSPFWGSV